MELRLFKIASILTVLLFSITSFAVITDVNGLEPAPINNLNESVIPLTRNLFREQLWF